VKIESQESVPQFTPEKSAMTPAVKHLPAITIAIPSMRRWQHSGEPAPEQYLKTLVASLYADMTAEERHSVHFLIMNVDKEPEKHAELLEIAKAIPSITVITKQPGEHLDLSFYIPPNSKGMFVDSTGREMSKETLNWRAGETMDAPRLWLAASANSEYVLFLEDDVVPTSRAVSKIYTLIKNLQDQGKTDILMVDLYTPAISWGPKSATNMADYPYECCTQAMLFKSSALPELCAYEFDHPELPVDDNIRDYIRANKDARKVLAMMPNPFEHVGRYSSNPEKSFGKIEHRSLEFEP
jgi:hypothetical protein